MDRVETVTIVDVVRNLGDGFTFSEVVGSLADSSVGTLSYKGHTVPVELESDIINTQLYRYCFNDAAAKLRRLARDA